MAEKMGGSIGGSLVPGSSGNMPENANTGGNGANTANIIGAILGPGGAGGALSGIGDIFCSIRGNCQPKVINQNYGNNGGLGMGVLVPVILLIVISVFFYFLFKK